MTAIRKGVLVVGSPRAEKSSSRALGTCLLEGLAARGVAVETVLLPFRLVSGDGYASALDAALGADLVVLAFPLYVDHLPAPVIAFLERYRDRLRGRPAERMTTIAAMVQCGFPEISHTRPAVEIVREFAAETGLAWGGGLAMGMGGAIDGRPLKQGGGMLWRQVAALDQAAAALSRGEPIPEAASEQFGRPLMPRWLYRFVANWGMKRAVRHARDGARAEAQPYLAGAEET